MISEETVLILGAGASKPYGFPTALELRKDIIFNTIPLLKKYAAENRPSDDFENHPYVKRVKDFIEIFKNSSTSSIDLFLSRNKEYYSIGKEIITLLLSNYEIESKFREEIKNTENDWYFYFYEALTRDIIKSEEILKLKENKVSIITFNYDRSLEHFIYESLLNSFRNKSNEIQEFMRVFKFIHVYGKLAPLPWESMPESEKYGSIFLRDYYANYSKNLQIIYEERKTKTEEIIEIVKKAKKIFFLGFGYAEENLTAIGFDQPILSKEQRIYGTALGLTNQEILKHAFKLRGKNNHIIIEKFHLLNCDSLMLLRNNF